MSHLTMTTPRQPTDKKIPTTTITKTITKQYHPSEHPNKLISVSAVSNRDIGENGAQNSTKQHYSIQGKFVNFQKCETNMFPSCSKINQI